MGSNETTHYGVSITSSLMFVGGTDPSVVVAESLQCSLGRLYPRLLGNHLDRSTPLCTKTNRFLLLILLFWIRFFLTFRTEKHGATLHYSHEFLRKTVIYLSPVYDCGSRVQDNKRNTLTFLFTEVLMVSYTPIYHYFYLTKRERTMGSGNTIYGVTSTMFLV